MASLISRACQYFRNKKKFHQIVKVQIYIQTRRFTQDTVKFYRNFKCFTNVAQNTKKSKMSINNSCIELFHRLTVHRSKKSKSQQNQKHCNLATKVRFRRSTFLLVVLVLCYPSSAATVRKVSGVLRVCSVICAQTRYLIFQVLSEKTR